MTNIAWTDATWNPLRARNKATGAVGWACVRVSKGCEHCYAAGQNKVQRWNRGTGLDYTVGALAQVETYLDERTLEQPLHWRKPKMIFVCSMTDLFGEWVTDEEIDRIFAVMALTPQHTYQVLTKRPERMREYLAGTANTYRMLQWMRAGAGLLGRDEWGSQLPWFEIDVVDPKWGRRSWDFRSWPPPNVWLGVSVEDQAAADERIPLLLDTPAAVRFISAEPLLEGIDFRPYLPYTPSHEANTVRREGLRSGSDGGTGDRQEGAHLAGAGASRRSMAENVPDEPMRAPSGGEQDGRAEPIQREALPANPADDSGSATLRDGASAGVAPLQRPDSAGHDDQSHQRREGRQPARESGIGNVRRSATARAEGAQARPGGSERREEREGKVDSARSAEDSVSASQRGSTEVDSGGLRSRAANDLENRPWGSLGVDQIIVGGESGPRWRVMEHEWVASIRDQCAAAGVAYFGKQGAGARSGIALPSPLNEQAWPEVTA